VLKSLGTEKLSDQAHALTKQNTSSLHAPIVLLSVATLEISLTLVKTNLQKINKNYERALLPCTQISISCWLSVTYVMAHNIFVMRL
jgi:hypothetical protein